jgi:Fe-S cluster assembly protein SufD
MADGVVIRVAADVRIERPIQLVFAYCSDWGGAVFARSQVVVGERARLTLLESHECFGAADYQVNSALDLAVGEDAQFDHVKLGSDGDGALHVSTIGATLGSNAQLRDFALTLGGTMVRNQLFVTCAGPGAQIDLRGAGLLHGRQHADTTLVLDHAVGGCRSRELFKAVLEDESRSVFQGKIIVRPKAQKTDARMMTQSLLLSETAETNSKPELEIFADDVQCGHGATCGALDDQLKFYLMARGIPAKEAEALLIKAFIGEAIDGVAHDGAREALAGVVAAKLDGRG